jgi:hypothetical protein
MQLSFLLAGLPMLALVLLFRQMLPTVNVRLQLGALLAADTTTLAPTLANKMALIVAPFTPSENLVYGDLTYGSTNGLIPIDLATGAQEVALDPVSQAQVITLVPGTGPGFRWVTSGSFSGPISVYGTALIDNGGTLLLGVQALPTPIVVSAAGYAIDLDPQTMTFVLQPLD